MPGDCVLRHVFLFFGRWMIVLLIRIFAWKWIIHFELSVDELAYREMLYLLVTRHVW